MIALALHIPLKMSEFIDVMALSSFVTMANSFIPIPGASGGTEMVFALLFGSLMKNLTGIMAFFNVSFCINYWWNFICACKELL